MQLRKSLIKKGQYFKGSKKFKNLKIDDADLNEMELMSEFGDLAHPQKTKNLRRTYYNGQAGQTPKKTKNMRRTYYNGQAG